MKCLLHSVTTFKLFQKKIQNNNESEEEDGGPDSQKEKSDTDMPLTIIGPGQIFWGTQTVLRFSDKFDKMDKLVSTIETKMKLETVIAKFIVTIEFDSKHHSLSSQKLRPDFSSN